MIHDENQLQELKLELIRSYEDLVPQVAFLLGIPKEGAREAVHQAICRAMAGLSKRPPGNPVIRWKSYIIRAAMNSFRKEREENSRVTLFGELDEGGKEKLLIIAAPDPIPQEQAEREELAELAWNALEELPTRQREVITKRCLGLSDNEIADQLETNERAVRVNFHYGIKTLRWKLRNVA